MTEKDEKDEKIKNSNSTKRTGLEANSKSDSSQNKQRNPIESSQLLAQIESWIRQRQYVLDRLKKSLPVSTDTSTKSTPLSPPVNHTEKTTTSAVDLSSDRSENDSNTFNDKSNQSILSPAEKEPLKDDSLKKNIERELEILQEQANRLAAENKTLHQELEEYRRILPNQTVVNIADFQALQNQNAVLKSQLARVESQHDNLKKAYSAADELSKKLQQEITQLQGQIAERDRLIENLKIRLADAVLDQNKAADDLRKVLDEYQALQREYQHLKTEHEELAKRLEITSCNEQTLLAKVNDLSNELQEVRKELVELRQIRENLEKELENKIVELNRAQEQAKKDADRVVELEHVRNLLTAAENRERELITTLEQTERERNRLRERLNRLLTGVKQYISSPPQPTTTDDNNSTPGQEAFGPYLPFCFPDSTPKALRICWRQQLQYAMPRSKASVSINAPLQPRKRRYFQYFLKPNISIPSQIAFQNSPTLFLPKEPNVYFHVSLPISEISAKLYTKTVLPNQFVLLPPLQKILPTFVSIHHRALNGPRRLYLAPKPMSIMTWSFDLYLEYLFSTVSNFYRIYSSFIEFRLKRSSAEFFSKEHSLGRLPEFKKNLPEKVAYISLYQIKFATLSVPRDKVVPDFQRRHLQLLIKSFGDSFSSVFSRLEQLLQSSSDKMGELHDKKPKGPQEEV